MTNKEKAERLVAIALLKQTAEDDGEIMCEAASLFELLGDADPVALIEAGKRLPRTRDGVPVVPLQQGVWPTPHICTADMRLGYSGPVAVYDVVDDNDETKFVERRTPVSSCFSTREAASAAKEQDADHGE